MLKQCIQCFFTISLLLILSVCVRTKVAENIQEEMLQESPGKSGNFSSMSIKGVWLSCNPHLEEILRQDANQLKVMGVNTIGFGIGAAFEKDGTCFTRSREQALINITLSKKLGFSVLFTIDFLGFSMGKNLREQGINITLDKYLAAASELSLEWAHIAEENNIEYFAPHNAFDGMMGMNFAHDEVEIGVLLSDWHADILPKLREVYSGKLVAKVGEIYPNYNVSGYDLIGLTISPTSGWDLKSFRDYVNQECQILKTVAEKSGCGWYLSEVWIPYGEIPGIDQVDTRLRNNYGISINEAQAEYYKITIEEYMKISDMNPIGFIFHPWDSPGSGIKGRPAQDILKKFFSGE